MIPSSMIRFIKMEVSMNERQKRVIRENHNLNASALSRFLGVAVGTVNSMRFREGIRAKWFYKGVGIPFLSVRTDQGYTLEIHCGKGVFASTSNTEKALSLVDHLIWCIEKGMFKQPRIEHPYFENLKLGGKGEFK